jgi:hypothetical protein
MGFIVSWKATTLISAIAAVPTADQTAYITLSGTKANARESR